ncbi:hypothetical protein PUN28_002017 [Cardiocondyla obscurior]|uniref:Uncharacterized protein n=1 Tax=Cardiocondyla obscurior TaxID=286306 RepID=A0AAW2GS56_9HYME
MWRFQMFSVLFPHLLLIVNNRFYKTKCTRGQRSRNVSRFRINGALVSKPEIDDNVVTSISNTTINLSKHGIDVSLLLRHNFIHCTRNLRIIYLSYGYTEFCDYMTILLKNLLIYATCE